MQSKSMTRKPSGRATPRKGAGAPAGTTPTKAQLRKAQLREAMSSEEWDIKQSRSVRTGWIWRGFFVLSLFAIGVAITMEANHHATLAILWLVIGAGWLATSMWLWRQHSRYMRGD
jgi:hypothetical protein